MLENLLKLVQEHAQDAIINNPAVPNEKNDAAIKATTDGIVAALKKKAAKGGIDDLKNMFNNPDAAGTPVMQNITQTVTNNLVKKLGIKSDVAQSLVANMLPGIISKFISRTNDPNDNGFQLDDIIKNISGGKGGGILGTLKGLFGG